MEYATFLFMQYVILRVALHEVLILIALGHVEANVKSFEKKTTKNENSFKNNTGSFDKISNEKIKLKNFEN